jgi:hypothetical protein
MKAPKGPFWIWNDIDGEGCKWRLAHVRPADGTAGLEQEIHYPLDDFDDYWYDDDWEPEDIVLIRQPKGREE